LRRVYFIKSKAGFSTYEIYNISIGQETGRLGEILKELSNYYNRKLKLQRQLISALSYPIIITITTIIVIIILMTFVVPVFSDIFRQMDKPLPPMTKLVIRISDLISHNLLVILLIPISLFIIYQLEKQKVWFRKGMAVISLKIPVFNEIIHKTYLARMCQSFSLLLSSHINTSEAVSLVEKMVDFYPLEEALKVVAKDLENGSSFHECLSKHKVFPKRLVSLIKVGEEVSKLEQIFGKIAQQYTEEVEYRSSIISTLMEPFIITIVGIVVAFILIALYQPMFDFSTNIVK
jgi:type IV pilus assembly protein PilC